MPFINLPDRIPGLRTRAPQGQPWYQFKNLAADEAELFLYDEIGGWGTLAENFIAELKAVTAPKLRVRMSSPGGSVFEGIAVANALRSHPAEVTAQVDGIAASIASVIAMAADRVVMQPQTTLMIHDASGLCAGDAADMQEMAELLDKLSDNIADAYAAKAGGTREQWRELMRAETWYLAEEAVAAGLADECMPMPKRGDGEPEMRHAFDLTAYGYRGPRQPEPNAPKPAPPAATPEPTAGQPTLTIPIGAALGEQIADALRAAVAPQTPAEPNPEPVTPSAPEVADTAVAPHNTAVEDGEWDGGANEKRLPSPVPVATVKKMYAVYDETQVEDGAVPKAAAKLPHHFVNEDGTPGAASVAAVRNALARLPQTEGLSDTEREEAERHLQAHLDAYHDADNQATASPQAEQRIVVQVDTDALAAALIEPLRKANQPQPEPAAPSLAARTAHLKPPARPAAPTWRDRVAHLTPPSSATTRPAS